MVYIKIHYIFTRFLFLSWMNDESPWMSLKVKLKDLVSQNCTHLEIIHKEHDHLPHTEEDGADRDPGQESDHVDVGHIFLWLGNTKQPGQETVPLMHFVAWGNENRENLD